MLTRTRRVVALTTSLTMLGTVLVAGPTIARPTVVDTVSRATALPAEAPEPVEPSVEEIPLEAAPLAEEPSSVAPFSTDPHDTAAGATDTSEELHASSDVSGFVTVGVVWQGPADPTGLTVEVRSESAAGALSAWEALEIEPGSQDSVPGTAPFVAGDVSRVEARVTGAVAEVHDVELVVIDPGTSAADSSDTLAPPVPAAFGGGSGTGLSSTGTTGLSSAGTRGLASTASSVPSGYPGSSRAPAFFSRAQWGADESLRTWSPAQGNVQAAVIHHTAGTNSYGTGDVPAILRGIYAYHAQTRGWGDIGYNFLVDKFGRIWEGRAGGIELETTGAHVSGYNTPTTGVSVLGNYQTATVSNAAVDAIVRLLGWKLSIHGVDAGGTTVINGQRLPTIFGHRDVASTSCPGQSLWIRQDEIRRRVKAEQSRYSGLWGTATGSFVMSPYRSDVYLVVGSTKHPVASMNVLWSNSVQGRVSDAADSYLSYLRTGKPLGRFVRDPRDGAVAYVDGNTRRRAPSCELVTDYGSACRSAVDLTAAQWSRLAAGPTLSRFVRSSADSSVFLVEGGTRRWVSSWDRLLTLNGGKSPTISVLSPQAVAEIRRGADA
ncbi:peptidoglycan recognition protein [Cellulosimicrobium sp. NPDC057862]|uniref:peptidoglycan recognition protein family protein n=1 Tax=Cellulosimicrobium sp. NPDC057862 TaxID=3346266 RepID=UPI003670FD6C